MSVSKQLKNQAALLRVLGSGSETPTSLQRQICQRCGKTWWPRRPTKPARCPGCKSPYWDRARRTRGAIAPLKERVTKEAVARAVSQGLQKAFRIDEKEGKGTEDLSLVKALTVLKEMKAAGKTWQEMGERMEQEFGTRLDKDQLKALVR